MKVQKLTVLDAARLAREIDGLRGSRITGVFRNESRTVAFIDLEKPALTLKYQVDGRISFLGVTDIIPANTFRVIPGLTGQNLLGASQINFDRIIEISLEKEDRLGRKKTARLILELIPNTGNMLFTDDAGSIKGSLKKNKVRKYVPPAPLKKPSILNFEDGRIREPELNSKSIIDRIYGLNERDMLNISKELQNEQRAAVKILEDYASRAVRQEPAWMIVVEGFPVGYSLVEPSLAQGESSVRYGSALLLYEAYYVEAAGREYEEQEFRSLLTVLDKEIDRQSRKVSDLEKAEAKSEDSLDFKKYGELILANIGQIKKGCETVRLIDLEASPSEVIEVRLDPALSPAANAETYFKKYRKAIASGKILKQRLKTSRDRLGLLHTIRDEQSQDRGLLEEKLKKLGIIKAPRKPSSGKEEGKRKPFRSFRAGCGWQILVGRTNADNDELTFRIAAKHDIWFHAWQAAGSHTILRPPSRNSVPDRRTLLEAASLAAYFSKARKSSKVPVLYTQVRYVRKPRKFPPGKVLVEREKQLMVKPGDPDDFLPSVDL